MFSTSLRHFYLNRYGQVWSGMVGKGLRSFGLGTRLGLKYPDVACDGARKSVLWGFPLPSHLIVGVVTCGGLPKDEVPYSGSLNVL